MHARFVGLMPKHSKKRQKTRRAYHTNSSSDTPLDDSTKAINNYFNIKNIKNVQMHVSDNSHAITWCYRRRSIMPSHSACNPCKTTHSIPWHASTCCAVLLYPHHLHLRPRPFISLHYIHLLKNGYRMSLRIFDVLTRTRMHLF